MRNSGFSFINFGRVLAVGLSRRKHVKSTNGVNHPHIATTPGVPTQEYAITNRIYNVVLNNRFRRIEGKAV